jgi:hypothetical protein
MRAELIHKGHVELKGQLRELDNLKVQNSLKEEELKIHKERLEESEVKINLLEARMESLRKNVRKLLFKDLVKYDRNV